MKYTIDRKTWRRGGDVYDEQFGETSLLNPQGFMCCLGQCLLQEGLTKDKLLNTPDPAGSEVANSFATVGDGESFDYYLNTSLAKKAMTVNDNPDLQDVEREEKLIQLFKDNNLEIEFIN